MKLETGKSLFVSCSSPLLTSISPQWAWSLHAPLSASHVFTCFYRLDCLKHNTTRPNQDAQLLLSNSWLWLKMFLRFFCFPFFCYFKAVFKYDFLKNSKSFFKGCTTCAAWDSPSQTCSEILDGNERSEQNKKQYSIKDWSTRWQQCNSRGSRMP